MMRSHRPLHKWPRPQACRAFPRPAARSGASGCRSHYRNKTHDGASGAFGFSNRGGAGGYACGATEPYVYKKDDFNRNAKTFNKEPEDRTEVTICYDGLGTSGKRVANMAEQECAKYGKTARRDHETFGVCPLLAPVEARFACVKADER